ncbi:glycosyltransferase family 2 protein [Angustibacter luteus]|uniref:Glycosyltransferase family 2 protein n=1 Tax=Angustibacter luteus TaxID=658456 RepID=A0ABW1JDN4_9ACTN
MFIAILEMRHTITDHGHLYLFSAFVALTWAIWALKVALSWRYRPWIAPYEVSTSVVIPVVDEPVDLFAEVLTRIVEQQPTEVIVVINGRRNPVLEQVCEQFAPLVQWTWTPVAGKRNAVLLGTEASVGDVVVLVDSDTIWTTDTLPELVKPFADPAVGGVTTRQRILEPERGFLTRWADWMENSRALYSMPAQSVLGSVGCLPGRTIAFRRTVLLDSMQDFMTQQFLGVFLEVSDDRTLTNLALKRGFKTVYQSTSLVYTDAPTELRKMRKQQLRWSRGSQYNTLRMLPWMLVHTPFLAFFFLADIILPFLLLVVVIAWGVRLATHTGQNLYVGLLHLHDRWVSIVAIVLLTILMSTLSMALRQIRHIEERPVDLLLMPVYTVFSSVFLMPLRMYGFLRLGHIGGWGTRADAYVADQGEATSGSDVRPGREHPEGLTSSPALAARLPTSPLRSPRSQPGDPRALVTYLIAVAAVTLGVLYDAQLV